MMSEKTMDLTAGVCPSAVESSLHNHVQALLKEMNNQTTSQTGLLRWALEKMVETDPSCSVSLISVLLKDLEKNLKMIHKVGSYMHIIPLLHTLHYVIIQSSSVIPSSLYHTVHECLMKLLIFPLPYSTVALSSLRCIKMEMTTPGSLYQRRTIAEQSLRNKHFTLQEKVFVLADPAVFSAPLEAAVRSHFKTSSLLKDELTKKLTVRVLQKGLGSVCQSSRLAQALEALEDQMVEKCFEKVVLAVEENIKHGASGHAEYVNTLQNIHGDILTAAKHETTEKDHDPVCGTETLFPEINFLLWKDEEDLWDLLANFTLRSHSINCSTDEEEKGKRDSDQSEDSGIERDLSIPPSTFTRRNAWKNMNSADKLSLMREKMEVFPGSSPIPTEDMRCHTARVVVMGDDRVLGMLTRAFHSIRERESKRLMLTKKLNLQLYYIPVREVVEPLDGSTDSTSKDSRLSLACLLGRMDPWYNSNINTLGAMMSNLVREHSEPSEQNLFLLDTLCYYLRCGTQPVNLPVYSVKMTRSSCNVTSVVEDVFVSHLEAYIPEFRHLKEKASKEPSARRKKSAVEVFGAIIEVKYTKMSLSKRNVRKGEARMACGVLISSEPAAVTTGEDCLTVTFDSMNPGYNTKVRTQDISIKTMEHRTLCVCLDRDTRLTYTDVQRIDIAPCLDPGFSIFPKFSVNSNGELLLSKYLNKVLSLPINTFTGVSL